MWQLNRLTVSEELLNHKYLELKDVFLPPPPFQHPPSRSLSHSHNPSFDFDHVYVIGWEGERKRQAFLHSKYMWAQGTRHRNRSHSINVSVWLLWIVGLTALVKINPHWRSKHLKTSRLTKPMAMTFNISGHKTSPNCVTKPTILLSKVTQQLWQGC